MDVILAILGGFAYRIRGGGGNEFARKLLGKPAEWEAPNGIIRSIWALFVTINLYFSHPQFYIIPLVFILAFIGTLPGYFGGKFDLSLKENNTWQNYTRLSARGLFITLPLTLCFFPIYPQLVYASLLGLLFVPCYLVGITLARYFPVWIHTQWGEFLLGAIITWGLL